MQAAARAKRMQAFLRYLNLFFKCDCVPLWLPYIWTLHQVTNYGGTSNLHLHFNLQVEDKFNLQHISSNIVPPIILGGIQVQLCVLRLWQADDETLVVDIEQGWVTKPHVDQSTPDLLQTTWHAMIPQILKLMPNIKSLAFGNKIKSHNKGIPFDLHPAVGLGFGDGDGDGAGAGHLEKCFTNGKIPEAVAILDDMIYKDVVPNAHVMLNLAVAYMASWLVNSNSIIVQTRNRNGNIYAGLTHNGLFIAAHQGHNGLFTCCDRLDDPRVEEQDYAGSIVAVIVSYAGRS
ncbi:hypothetical protein ACJX0J_008899, partial [Zea mays]